MKADAQTVGRRELRRRERRARILAVAAQSFREKGYAGTSMTSISALLGGSKSTLWNYFDSKEDIFLAVVENNLSEYRRINEDISYRSKDIREFLFHFCQSFMGLLVSSEVVVLNRLVISEGSRFPEAARLFYEGAIDGIRIVIVNFVNQYISEGCLRKVDPVGVARALISLCAARQHDMLVGGATPDQMQIDAEATFVVDIFLRAFAVDRS